MVILDQGEEVGAVPQAEDSVAKGMIPTMTEAETATVQAEDVAESGFEVLGGVAGGAAVAGGAESGAAVTGGAQSGAES